MKKRKKKSAEENKNRKRLRLSLRRVYYARYALHGICVAVIAVLCMLWSSSKPWNAWHQDRWDGWGNVRHSINYITGNSPELPHSLRKRKPEWLGHDITWRHWNQSSAIPDDFPTNRRGICETNQIILAPLSTQEGHRDRWHNNSF